MHIPNCQHHDKTTWFRRAAGIESRVLLWQERFIGFGQNSMFLAEHKGVNSLGQEAHLCLVELFWNHAVIPYTYPLYLPSLSPPFCFCLAVKSRTCLKKGGSEFTQQSVQLISQLDCRVVPPRSQDWPTLVGCPFPRFPRGLLGGKMSLFGQICRVSPLFLMRQPTPAGPQTLPRPCFVLLSSRFYYLKYLQLLLFSQQGFWLHMLLLIVAEQNLNFVFFFISTHSSVSHYLLLLSRFVLVFVSA